MGGRPPVGPCTYADQSEEKEEEGEEQGEEEGNQHQKVVALAVRRRTQTIRDSQQRVRLPIKHRAQPVPQTHTQQPQVHRPTHTRTPAQAPTCEVEPVDGEVHVRRDLVAAAEAPLAGGHGGALEGEREAGERGRSRARRTCPRVTEKRLRCTTSTSGAAQSTPGMRA